MNDTHYDIWCCFMHVYIVLSSGTAKSSVSRPCMIGVVWQKLFCSHLCARGKICECANLQIWRDRCAPLNLHVRQSKICMKNGQELWSSQSWWTYKGYQQQWASGAAMLRGVELKMASENFTQQLSFPNFKLSQGCLYCPRLTVWPRRLKSETSANKEDIFGWQPTTAIFNTINQNINKEQLCTCLSDKFLRFSSKLIIDRTRLMISIYSNHNRQSTGWWHIAIHKCCQTSLRVNR